MQEALVWTGFYAGPLDGQLGQGSERAIRKFQRSLERHADGILKPDENQILIAISNAKKAKFGFSYIVDSATGVRVGFPTKLFPKRQKVPHGSNFYSADSHIIVGIRYYVSPSKVEVVFQNLKDSLYSTQIKYAVQRPTWFAVSGTGKLKNYYFRFFKVPYGYQGMFAVYDSSDVDRFRAPINMISLTFSPLKGRPSPEIEALPAVDNIPLDPVIAADLMDAMSPPALPTTPVTPLPSVGHTETTTSTPAPPYPTAHTETTTPLLDSIRALISSTSGAKVKFFTYKVPKTELTNFKSDMPVLRVVFDERVFFDTDKANLRPEALPVLDSVASSLRQQSNAFAVFIAGHTDSRGSDLYNLDLSMRRADSVARALVSKGVGPALIWRVGFGKALPLRPNSSLQNMAYNRRVEFFVAKHPTVVATLFKTTKSWCEKGELCDHPSNRSTFDALPVERNRLNKNPPKVTILLPEPIDRAPIPNVVITRPSLLDFHHQ